ncbi:hypothetical protein Verru16b_01693 [Lacunisphaera limnophila]|uniref:Uncharacterized protein n=1 Tax=Lacunisphaera limnophila TaxID=1838286 RepID=A0A1D8AUQ6_9BACT|nr:hypothetical protein [Lacunisphaera limnophila]AOS44627.1 hypothetical protein Verru16b_01693 [Lacunisphaera limnophila]
MSESRQNSKPTLEELLRLKRAERPSAEFWNRFETELRQKQLTALVEKRRWWHDLPVLLNRRVYVPAGAAAVVAFSLVTVRYTAPLHVVEIENTAPRIEAADPAVEMLPATVVASTSGRFEEPIEVAPSALTASARVTEQVPAPTPVSERRDISPSARSIAANLARLEQSEPDMINAVIGNRLSTPAREPVLVAQSDFENTGSRESAGQYRLIARYAERALSPEPSAPALVRERIARRLGEDLGDDISRIGLRANRVSLKF